MWCKQGGVVSVHVQPEGRRGSEARTSSSIESTLKQLPFRMQSTSPTYESSVSSVSSVRVREQLCGGCLAFRALRQSMQRGLAVGCAATGGTEGRAL